MWSWLRKKPKPASLCEEDFITIPQGPRPTESPVFVTRSVMEEPEPVPTVEDVTENVTELVFPDVPKTEPVSESAHEPGLESAHEPGLESGPAIEGDSVPPLIHQESTGSVVIHDGDDVVGDYEWKYDSNDEWSPYQAAPKEDDNVIETPEDIVTKATISVDESDSISDDDLNEEDLADSLDAFIQRLINLSDSVDKRSSRNACDIAEIARSCSESISAITLAISNRIRDITERSMTAKSL